MKDRKDLRRGVIFLLTGISHAVRLVVALWSLRKHYGGPVTIYTTQPESHRIGEMLFSDPRLQVRHEKLCDQGRARNSSYVAKASLMADAPFEINLFLDADTLVSGSIDELFELGDGDECIATQFANWTTKRRVIRKRLESWRDLQSDEFGSQWMNETIDAAMNGQPALNTGVLAFRQTASILNPWQRLTRLGRKKFICDEIAFQLLVNRHPHRVLDCRFNCSPVHSAGTEDVRVWHFHGDKHIRHAQGRKLWLPVYDECCQENVAQLANWTPDGDRRLEALLSEQRHTAPGRRAVSPASPEADLDATLVTSVDPRSVRRLRHVLGTWKRKPDVVKRPLIVINSGLPGSALRFLRRNWDGSVRIIDASQQDESLQPSDAVHHWYLLHAPALVETEYWIKLEPDVAFVNSESLFPREALDVDVFGHRWGYSRPASWLEQLDNWFCSTDFAAGAGPLGRSLSVADGSDRLNHSRFVSWAALHRTSFSQAVAAALAETPPIPSHDTTLWYVASRAANYDWGASNLKKRGAMKVRSRSRLKELASLPQFEPEGQPARDATVS